MASTVSLVPAAQAVAVPALVPIKSVPLLTVLTTNAVTVPSTSASLPCACRFANVIVAWASSLTETTGAAIVVSVGASLTAVMLIVAVSEFVSDPPPVLPLSLTYKRQRRAGAGRVGVVDVAHRAGAIGAQQVVDLRHRAGDRHRRSAGVVTTAPLPPAVTVSVPSVTDSVTVIEPEAASTSLIDSPVFLSVRATCSVARSWPA